VRREDLSAAVKRGLELVGAVSSQRVLPLIDEALLDARQGSYLTPCSSPRGQSCAKGDYRESKQKALVD
jgi:hypothetical protein